LTVERKKANGEDCILSNKMLKETCQSINKLVGFIFKRSLALNIFPVKWKTALVMPLFKKGDNNTPSNYRPISPLSSVGKMLERILYNILKPFTYFNDLIHKNESGFRPNHSAVYQLILLNHQIYHSLDDKLFKLFCETSKALIILSGTKVYFLNLN
jgi:hypothetical protein